MDTQDSQTGLVINDGINTERNRLVFRKGTGATAGFEQALECCIALIAAVGAMGKFAAFHRKTAGGVVVSGNVERAGLLMAENTSQSGQDLLQREG